MKSIESYHNYIDRPLEDPIYNDKSWPVHLAAVFVGRVPSKLTGLPLDWRLKSGDKVITEYYELVRQIVGESTNPSLHTSNFPVYRITPTPRGTRIRTVVDTSPWSESSNFNSDGIHTTRLRNKILATQMADCVGLVIYNTKTEECWNLHLGVLNTEAGSLDKLLYEISSSTNCNVKDLVIYISPSAGKLSYDLTKTFGHDLLEKFNIDAASSDPLWKGVLDNRPGQRAEQIKVLHHHDALIAIMARAGIERYQIYLSKVDTIKDHLFHSYRRSILTETHAQVLSGQFRPCHNYGNNALIVSQ